MDNLRVRLDILRRFVCRVEGARYPLEYGQSYIVKRDDFDESWKLTEHDNGSKRIQICWHQKPFLEIVVYGGSKDKVKLEAWFWSRNIDGSNPNFNHFRKDNITNPNIEFVSARFDYHLGNNGSTGQLTRRNFLDTGITELITSENFESTGVSNSHRALIGPNYSQDIHYWFGSVSDYFFIRDSFDKKGHRVDESVSTDLQGDGVLYIKPEKIIGKLPDYAWQLAVEPKFNEEWDCQGEIEIAGKLTDEGDFCEWEKSEPYPNCDDGKYISNYGNSIPLMPSSSFRDFNLEFEFPETQ